MKKIVKLLSLILLIAMMLSACAQAATPTAAPQAAAATRNPTQPTATTAPISSQQVQVTEADQGKDFMLNPGDSLIIVLDSNPSTGYAWKVKPVDNPVLTLAGKPVFKADSDKRGAPGKTTLTLNAVASGSQVLTLLYQRSFETNTQPAKTFTVNVTVSGSTLNSTTTTQPSAAIANPAAKYCTDQGFKREIRTAADESQSSVCKFPNGSECDEWAFFRGECKAGQ